MDRTSSYQLGAKATCRQCGKPIEYSGLFWRHTTCHPRHIALPGPREVSAADWALLEKHAQHAVGSGHIVRVPDEVNLGHHSE